ncbi:two-component system response regulator YesN [Caldicoprobacter guelmensis]|uniref:response regulator transcription factor n=1 Tax=Caldicoprobacter guelmensis TaxID=1170224 RepID=UPI0019562077|nr:response regulator [Caldicoprobacter guelmensis]MBM7582214.1 two-component system response regulator YesN [Caldicoprobacter guelmensis]
MYKLLLVDDEQIIREGIIQLVNWDYLGIQVDDAENGIEAYEKIKNTNPDIVITDIKMPGMDGLELIERVKREFPDIIFIILSGYGEFNFASRAMQYGVKYYLLKPCDEDEITQVLCKVLEELKQNKEQQEFIKKMEEDLQKIIPYVKEQFSRDCVMGQLKDEKDVVYFRELLKLPSEKIRLLLFRLDDNNEFEKRFALKNLLDYYGKDYYLLSTIIGENVLLLQKAISLGELFSYLKEIKESFYNYCGISVTVAISSEGFFEQLPDLYNEVMGYLEHRFYLGEDCIITRDDVGNKGQSIQPIINFDYQYLGLLIRSGNIDAVCKELNTFFTKLNNNKFEPDMVRALCIEFYISIIRQAKPQNLNEYMKQISMLQNIATLDKMFNFIMSVANEITEEYYKENQAKNSQIIKTVLRVIEENISFEDLSLSWIAEKIVYMNVDYLGKLFKKEVGKNFSAYLMEKRVEKAKQLLLEESCCKISDIAKCVGYGNNPQYFGQVFKKITGYTPSEYKKMLGYQK